MEIKRMMTNDTFTVNNDDVILHNGRISLYRDGKLYSIDHTQRWRQPRNNLTCCDASSAVIYDMHMPADMVNNPTSLEHAVVEQVKTALADQQAYTEAIRKVKGNKPGHLYWNKTDNKIELYIGKVSIVDPLTLNTSSGHAYMEMKLQANITPTDAVQVVDNQLVVDNTAVVNCITADGELVSRYTLSITFYKNTREFFAESAFIDKPITGVIAGHVVEQTESSIILNSDDETQCVYPVFAFKSSKTVAKPKQTFTANLPAEFNRVKVSITQKNLVLSADIPVDGLVDQLTANGVDCKAVKGGFRVQFPLTEKDYYMSLWENTRMFLQIIPTTVDKTGSTAGQTHSRSLRTQARIEDHRMHSYDVIVWSFKRVNADNLTPNTLAGVNLLMDKLVNVYVEVGQQLFTVIDKYGETLYRQAIAYINADA